MFRPNVGIPHRNKPLQKLISCTLLRLYKWIKPWFECVILSDLQPELCSPELCLPTQLHLTQAPLWHRVYPTASKLPYVSVPVVLSAINEKVHLIKALMCALYYLKWPHKTFSINFSKCRTGRMYFTQAMVQHFSPPPNSIFPTGVRTFEQRFIISTVWTRTQSFLSCLVSAV